MNKIASSITRIVPTAALFAALLLLLSPASPAQSTYNSSTVDLTVSGTSTLHDWDMKSIKANCTATFTQDETGHITGLTALTFSTPANALKSEHTSMDNNAYKALKSDKNPAIIYTMTSATVTPGDGGTVTIKTAGKLTIAGTTRDQELVAIVKPNTDNTFAVSGSRTISMKDFNMQPPTFMLGAVKTGNDVTLKFNLTLKK
ncbi:MAG: YceI family protein [Chitinophagaceae bacterium]|nr:YceI family protein [Chitinophagaceae bacterium]